MDAAKRLVNTNLSSIGLGQIAFGSESNDVIGCVNTIHLLIENIQKLQKFKEDTLDSQRRLHAEREQMLQSQSKLSQTVSHLERDNNNKESQLK